MAPIHPNDTQKEAMEKIFRDVAGDDMEIDWMELKRILDQTMRDGKFFAFDSIPLMANSKFLNGK